MKGSYNGTEHRIASTACLDSLHVMVEIEIAHERFGRRMKAMILAAGRGERMGALTAAQPKPLLDDRRPCRSSSITSRDSRRAASTRSSSICRIAARKFASTWRSGSRFGVSIAYSEEGEPPLETAGGIVHALPLLGSSRSCS